MRIDEFSGSFDGTFSSAEKMRFISVGFDITAVAVTVGQFIERNLILQDNTGNLMLIDNTGNLVLE